MAEDSPVYVFVLSWERPLYLWNCLDSLYRCSSENCRIVLADNNSKDPLVKEVIESFEKRGLFYALHLESENDPNRFPKMIERYWHEIVEYFVLIESDIEIIETDRPWDSIMRSHLDHDSTIGSIGSRVYQKDFVPKETAKLLEPDLAEEELDFLIKTYAPMRFYVETEQPLITPHNPPLRLLMMRKNAFQQVGFARDTVIHKKMVENGWKSVISTKVVHRHLSLLNIFDYASYEKSSREAFFNPSNYN